MQFKQQKDSWGVQSFSLSLLLQGSLGSWVYGTHIWLSLSHVGTTHLDCQYIFDKIEVEMKQTIFYEKSHPLYL